MVISLLLTSEFSDDFSLGNAENFISKHGDLEKRIIRYKVENNDFKYHDIEQFIKNYNYSQLNQVDINRIIVEFLLERFFERMTEKGNFEAHYIEGYPGETFAKGFYLYEFVNSGRNIRVYTSDKTKPITEFSRIVKLKKGEKEQFIICDPKSNARINSIEWTIIYLNKIHSAQNLAEHYVSYMQFFPEDVFRKIISPMTIYHRGKSYSSRLEFIMSKEKYVYNFSVVYSLSTSNIERLKNKIVKRLHTL